MVFCKIGVLTNVAKFATKHRHWNLAFNKVEDLQRLTLPKKESGTGVFSKIFAKFFIKP